MDSSAQPLCRATASPRPSESKDESKQAHAPLSPSEPTATSAASAAAQDERTARRVSRKLQKRRRDGVHTPSFELPERLRETNDEADSDEEVLRPQAYPGGMFMNMHQSIFGLVAAVGRQANFSDRFESLSSDDEDDESPLAKTIAAPRQPSPWRPDHSSSSTTAMAQTTLLPLTARSSSDQHSSSTDTPTRHRRKISENLLRSVPGLSRFAEKLRPSKSSKEKSAKAPHDDSAADRSISSSKSSSAPPTGLAPAIEITRTEGMGEPIMSKLLEARAQVASRPSFELDRLTEEEGRAEGDDGTIGPSELAKTLKHIFEFERPEEVIQEYPCWLLQHVLLQGYMFITTRHIAFYAYLPKKANEVVKSGYLSKCGKRNPKYNRYWFRLKGVVLSYYRDPQDLYFPSGHIDLRYGISASITDKDKEGINFTIETHNRTYYFRADSAQSAKEWVKCIQRVIFRSHNDGDSVKISLPIENIIDIEETHMLDFAETCKIRVIDNDETYAIDEYYFSFFSYGKDAINLLKILIDDSSSQARDASDGPDKSLAASTRTSMSASRDQAQGRPGRLTEGVKATLSPMTPPRCASPVSRASQDRPRSSFDAFRPFRRSIDVAQSSELHPTSPSRSYSKTRRSFSKHRREALHEQQGSSDSFVQSVGDPSQASLSALVHSASSEDPSASQILRGSEVFHSPIFHRSSNKAEDTEEPVSAGIVRHDTDATVKPSTQQGTARQENAVGATATTPTLQSIANMGGYPFRKANALMGYLDRQSRRMSNLLATESMGYVEKVSGMWKGGGKHYDDPAGLRTDEEDGQEDPNERANSEARFREHFALPETERLQAAYFGYMMRVLPLYGKIYIGDRHFCFRSLLPGTRTKLVLPLRDIENVDKEKGFRFGYSGLVVVIRGHEELFFEFSKAEVRDDCAVTVLQSIEATRFLPDSSLLDGADSEDAQAAVAERDALQEARNEEFGDHELQLPRQASSVTEAPTILFDDSATSFLSFKPAQSMTITCLTIGSRGDVQPYIALCKKLLEEGHRPRIATHLEFKDWIESHGIEFAYVGGDPGELMRLCIQNGTFTWQFLKEANAKFRGFLDDLLATSWEACQGSDLIIESPSAMAGIHIAEALEIPYFRAFTMPWTRTRAYPHAFVMPGQKMGGAYNYLTYVMFDTVFWKTTAHQINKWRNNMLGLPSTNLEKLQVNKVPFLYNFSAYVVPPPLDYSDWIRVTGYWFLDEGDNNSKWTPPPELRAFIEKARSDGKKLVYVGFGSIIVPDRIKMTQDVIDAVLKADVRCILSKGWSDRSKNPDQQEQEPELPPEIFQIQSAPHDWLFRQIDAAAHHGGSGTTGASLRAGIPTIIRPFFGDQFFFGSRVEDLGVGICLKKWGANSFARALWEATHSERMIVKARVLGEQIRKENGVETAVQCIYRDLEYATNLIKAKARKNPSRRNTISSGTGEPLPAPANATASNGAEAGVGLGLELGTGGDGPSIDFDDEEESWTFVDRFDDHWDYQPQHHQHGFLRNPALTAPASAAKSLGSKVLGGAVGGGK
ncbi:uncharacterized protein CTHT_0049260 [Thermochaetoides thermophila DSM 1495]|uniref:Sterol 3-beta-glucosyltransferase n=1 Tax=Chaetomium thermophilum (strain DSM 1495 / CBS 144.50 / IMI 039719) TaxID=759272 RepID=G0SB85_CHATD|nr:hypothetical protein CTHT_0049260 [Thermochaetoides thermophila DSM 1495]EGS19465.1 hypothetical protein CTHT_0049260 [Thermochaetoides thermophila DSM 1495]